MARRITYTPNRVIDSNGISDGASIYVYQTGTTTLVPIYSDAALSSSLTNPYVVASGAAVPTIYHNHTGDVRVKVVNSGGSTVSDDDPAPTSPIDLIAFADAALAATLAASEDAQVSSDEAAASASLAQIAAASASSVSQAAADALALGTISDLVGTRIYASRALLNADLVPADNLYALVVGDATAANNDLYQKNGATTAGSWDGPLGIFAAASASAQASATAAAASAASVATVTDEVKVGLGIGAPAARMLEASGTISPSVYRAHTPTNGIIYEVLVVARPEGTRKYVNVFNNGTSILSDVTFNLEDGTFSVNAGIGTGSSRYLGGGFYECKVTVTAAGTTGGNWQVRPSPAGVNTFTGSTSDGVWLKSIVLREQNTTTNIFPSSDPANAAFTKASLTATAGTSPEQRTTEFIKAIDADVTSLETFINGSMTMDKLVEASGSVTPSLYRAVNYTSGSTYVTTYEVRASERSRVNVYNNGTGFLIDVTADLSTGVVTVISASTTATLTALNNDCYRLVVTKVATATNSGNMQLRIYPASGGHPYTGDGASGVFLNSATLTVNGGANIWTSPTDFTSGAWSKLSMTISANTGLWLGLPVISPSAPVAAHPLSGKKVVVLGTSLVEQNYWTSAFQTETGCTLINLGVSGASYGLSSFFGDSRIGQCSSKLNTTDIPSDTALIIVGAPVNDPYWKVPVGVESDTTTATFAGALANVSIWAAANRPNAQVVYEQMASAEPASATHRHGGLAAGSQATLAELAVYQAMLKAIANREGRPLIDINDFGISWRRTDVRSDLLHWNTFGGAWIGRIFEAETLRLAEEGWLVI